MLHIILYQPEIPPNTGNIIRLCANTGFSLHLIHPLGFKMDEKSLRRAGCDYHIAAMVKEYNSLDECINYLQENNLLNNLYAFTTKGSRTYIRQILKKMMLYYLVQKQEDCQIILNSTSSEKLRIPMQENSRSLNLSNSVAIAAFEAWRQLEFNY